jgi:hypothetical protein
MATPPPPGTQDLSPGGSAQRPQALTSLVRAGRTYLSLGFWGEDAGDRPDDMDDGIREGPGVIERAGHHLRG